MSFEQFMVGFGWFAAIVFIGVAAYRIARIARLPLNVRWEVYPVPHEAKEKRGYGGSYMEELDWATTRRESFQAPTYREIAAEVTTLKRVREHNGYGLWPLALAMHWGLYLYFGWLVLLALSNVVHLSALWRFTTATGLASHCLGAVGAMGLLIKRTTDRDLRLYTTPIDYFNLIFLATMFLTALFSWLGNASFAAHRAYIGSVLSLNPVPLSTGVYISFLVFELFMIYMPFTKLIHYFAKYFTFHQALWDDDFKAKGSAVDHQVTEQLGFNADWAGPHIAQGQTWLQQAQLPTLPERSK